MQNIIWKVTCEYSNGDEMRVKIGVVEEVEEETEVG